MYARVCMYPGALGGHMELWSPLCQSQCGRAREQNLLEHPGWMRSAVWPTRQPDRGGCTGSEPLLRSLCEPVGEGGAGSL